MATKYNAEMATKSMIKSQSKSVCSLGAVISEMVWYVYLISNFGFVQFPGHPDQEFCRTNRL